MSDTQKNPWSDNPNAPKIPHDVYFADKADFSGLLIAAILYGASNTPPHTPPPIRAQLVRSRDPRHAFLPIHGRVTQPRQS